MVLGAPDIGDRVTIEFQIEEKSELTGLGQGEKDAPEPEPDPFEGPPALEGPPAPPIVAKPPPKKPRPARKPRPKPALSKDSTVVIPTPAKDDGKPPETAKAEPAEPPEEASEEGLRPVYEGEVPFEVRPVPQVASIASGNAAMTVAVDARALRRSHNRAHYARMIQAIPDYHRVTGDSGVEAIDAYEKVLISSANFTQLTETILVAETKTAQDVLKTHLDKAVGEQMAWEEQSGIPTAAPEEVWWAKQGDPRLFALPAPGIVAFTKPGLVPVLAQRGKKAEAFFPAFPKSLSEGSKGLPTIFLLEMSGLTVGLPGPASRLPSFRAIQMAIHDDVRPLVRIRLVFDSPKKAARFAERWPGVQRELLDMFVLKLMGYNALIGRITGGPDGELAYYMEARFEQKDVERISLILERFVKTQYRHFMQKPTAALDAGLEGDAEVDGGGMAEGSDVGIEADKPDLGDKAPAAAPRPRLWKPRQRL